MVREQQMKVTPNEIYGQIRRRAKTDPLVAEILRSCALEAALEKMQQILPVEEDAELEAVEG